MNAKLKILIKNGKVINTIEKLDIYNKTSKQNVYTPVDYAYLLNYANQNSIDLNELHAHIVVYGSELLILDALNTTKDVKTFAKSWFEKSKLDKEYKNHLLEKLGYVNNEKKSISKPVNTNESDQLTLVYQDSLIAKKILTSSYKKLENLLSKHNVSISSDGLVKTAMKHFKLDFNNYTNLLNEINDEKLFNDILKNHPFDVNLLQIYLNKFNDYQTIKNYVFPYICNLRENNSIITTRKKADKVLLNNNYIDEYLKIIKLITESQLPPFKKTTLLYNLTIFDNLSFKKLYKQLAQQISLPILESYGKLYLNTKSKDNLNLCFDILYNPNIYYHERFGKIVEYELINLLNAGHVQEYIKYYFINKNQRIDAYLRASSLNMNVNGYHQTEVYKKLPIPIECLYNFQKQPYPFFIIIQNAKRRPGFSNELIKDPLLYEQGFKHEIFRDPYYISEDLIDVMKNDPLLFLRNYNKELNEDNYYFIPQRTSISDGVFVKLERKRNIQNFEDEYDRYDLLLIAKKEDDNLKIFNKGCKSRPYAKDILFGRNTNEDYIEHINQMINEREYLTKEKDAYFKFIETIEPQNETNFFHCLSHEEVINLKEIPIEEHLSLDFDPEYIESQDLSYNPFIMTEEELDEYISKSDAILENDFNEEDLEM